MKKKRLRAIFRPYYLHIIMIIMDAFLPFLYSLILKRTREDAEEKYVLNAPPTPTPPPLPPKNYLNSLKILYILLDEEKKMLNFAC